MLSQEPSDEDQYWQNSTACVGWPPRSSERETGTDGTREVLLRTTTTPVLLKVLSRPRRGRVPKTEKDEARVAACKKPSTWSRAISDRLSLLQFDSVLSPLRQPNHG